MSDEERKADGADFAALLDFLHETPNRLARLTDGLLLAELRLKHSEAEFSGLENLCHLRDLELHGYTPRIRRLLDEGDPALADFNGARVAAEGNLQQSAAGPRPADVSDGAKRKRAEVEKLDRGTTKTRRHS